MSGLSNLELYLLYITIDKYSENVKKKDLKAWYMESPYGLKEKNNYWNIEKYYLHYKKYE